MSKKTPKFETLNLDTIVGGGQTLGTLDNGRKAFVWCGLPNEKVTIRITKKKKNFVEGIVTEIHKKSPYRIEPIDPESFLSTSPWQIMSFDAEQHYKSALIEEAFELHNIVLPDKIDVYSNKITTHYRNKVEFCWFGGEKNGKETLDLAFYMRGSSGKIIINDSSLFPKEIIKLAKQIRNLLHSKNISARSLKTLLIRCDANKNCVWQLYIKEKIKNIITEQEASNLSAIGGEIIYSDPKSPASKITERLASFGNTILTDNILGIDFQYTAESFFQVNLPLYEKALVDMKKFMSKNKPIVDLYSGVGTIGLTIGDGDVTLVEINEYAVKEMKRNIKKLKLNKKARAILSPSEKALDYIDSNATIIVDPPRAGLHKNVIEKLLSSEPERIIYLSCNPVTQARDVAMLADKYGIKYHKGYNFFPRTPHIEHLVVLDKIQNNF